MSNLERADARVLKAFRVGRNDRAGADIERPTFTTSDATGREIVAVPTEREGSRRVR